MAALFVAAMREWKRSLEGQARSFAGLQMRIEKVMDVTIAREVERLERRLLVLATVGSAGPFVGLLGTVWGIMTSFRAIAGQQSTSLAVVAPGIAEALFATAIGLIAAIPATIFYNKFVVRGEQAGPAPGGVCGRILGDPVAADRRAGYEGSRTMAMSGATAAAETSRRRGRRRHGVMSEINVTPMVDVMLVLLIIFMVAAPLLTSSIPVDLPEAKATVTTKAKTEQLTVTARKASGSCSTHRRILPGRQPDQIRGAGSQDQSDQGIRGEGTRPEHQSSGRQGNLLF